MIPFEFGGDEYPVPYADIRARHQRIHPLHAIYETADLPGDWRIRLDTRSPFVRLDQVGDEISSHIVEAVAPERMAMAKIWLPKGIIARTAEIGGPGSGDITVAAIVEACVNATVEMATSEHLDILDQLTGVDPVSVPALHIQRIAYLRDIDQDDPLIAAACRYKLGR